MEHRVIAIDQSTSATKSFLFDGKGAILASASVPHRQFYPREGWVEHDAEEIYANTVKAIAQVADPKAAGVEYSVALTNQRETVVVWDRHTGKPVCNAVVWQCMRGKEICEELKRQGLEPFVSERSGLLLDPYFSASGVKWILDNVAGVRGRAEAGDLLLGTIDSWLIWKLTGGKSHVIDYTNAARTLLFNIHTLEFDDELLRVFTVPRSMVPRPLPSDSVFGETTVEGLFAAPVRIAGDLGDSNGALAGQMCFAEGLGKATYGTGSSVMVNIGEQAHKAPDGLVTSVGLSALGKVFYGFEGNIHSTGATLSWLKDTLKLIGDPQEADRLAASLADNGGVYLVPAFVGLGAPWWRSDVRASIFGLTFGTGKEYVCRAAIESIAYQVADLVKAMTDKAGIALRDLRVDGGPTKNKFMMQFQADLLGVPVVRSEVSDASAFGAFLMNCFARKAWSSFGEAQAIWKGDAPVMPRTEGAAEVAKAYAGWHKAVAQLTK